MYVHVCISLSNKENSYMNTHCHRGDGKFLQHTYIYVCINMYVHTNISVSNLYMYTHCYRGDGIQFDGIQFCECRYYIHLCTHTQSVCVYVYTYDIPFCTYR